LWAAAIVGSVYQEIWAINSEDSIKKCRKMYRAVYMASIMPFDSTVYTPSISVMYRDICIAGILGTYRAICAALWSGL
jgi:hypothetical protein